MSELRSQALRRRLTSPAALSALALLAYLAIAVAVTYPVAFQLTTHIAGLPGNDSLEFVWSTWWFKHALFDLQTNPLRISLLNHPDGLYFPLLPAMSQPFLLSLPLAALASPVVAFNVTYLASFPLCGLAGYWLCGELSGDRRAGFVGGLIWAFFPNKSGHALAGHLFQLVVFTLPLAALFLLRLFRRPSARSAVWAGLALAAAATIHPINVAYFLLPLLVVILGAEAWGGLARLPWKWLALAGAVASALAIPLFAPAVIEAFQGGLGFLAERGTVGFSLDLLAFVVPPPGNPIIAGTPLAELSGRVAPFQFETIAYVGAAPLALALLGLRWRWRDSRRWLTLGLAAAVLSLGPVLHVGREIVRLRVEDDRFPVLMPYAFLGQLPFLRWSRTPGRLDETVMFAVAILASLGMAAVLARIRIRSAGWALWLAACAIIPIEYIVRWPMPTAPIPASPALARLAGDSSFEAVINFPVPENTINLYSLLQQTLHQHPMVGGRVYRDVPGSGITHDFLSRMLASGAAPAGADIAPGPTSDQRAAALAYYGVGRVVYQPEGDADGSGRAALEGLLGLPLADDPAFSIYRVPPAPAEPLAPFFVFGSNWYAPEPWPEPARWFRGIATVYAFSDANKAGALAFTAIPGRDLRRLIIKVNGAEVVRFGVGDWAEYVAPGVAFHQGLNSIEFFDEDGSWAYVGDPRCQGGSAVAGPFPVAVPCDAANREARDLSLAIQNLRLVPDAAPYAAQATFGDTLELLEAAAAARARPGDSIVVHFAWRTAQALNQDYTMFVHLLDAGGNYVNGADGYPARGSHPTTRWQVGQIVRYNVALTVPPETPPGDYALAVGWYQWPSLERFPLANGDTSLTLATVEIAP